MEWMMILGIALVLLGFAGTFLPVLPGVPVVFIGLLLVAWQDHFASVSEWTMGGIGLLAVFAIGIDFFASFFTTKKVGASKHALWGIAIGGLVGLFAGPLGLFFGAAIGALVGEFLAHRDMSKATTVGLAAGLGFAVALVIKVVTVFIMLAIFIYAYYY